MSRSAPYLFVAAGVVYLLIFTAIPLIRGLALSFTDTRLLNPNGGSFIGLENYATIISDGQLWNSLLTTLVYSFFTVIGSLLFGTIGAVVMNRAFPGRFLARAVMIMPWAVPTVAVALVFRWIFNNNSGIANEALGVLGIGAQGWLTDPDRGMLSVLIATIWKVTPFVMLVVLAALQSVPDEVHEAARVDGARAYSTFTLVVLPYIVPTLRVAALLMTIWSFRRFEIIWLLTGGGPVGATETIVIDVYRQAFENSQLGIAAAVGMCGLVLSLIATVIYFVVEQRSTRREGAL